MGLYDAFKIKDIAAQEGLDGYKNRYQHWRKWTSKLSTIYIIFLDVEMTWPPELEIVKET